MAKDLKYAIGGKDLVGQIPLAAVSSVTIGWEEGGRWDPAQYVISLALETGTHQTMRISAKTSDSITVTFGAAVTGTLHVRITQPS